VISGCIRAGKKQSAVRKIKEKAFMTIIDDMIGSVRGGGVARPKRVRMGIAGEGPELSLVADAFRASHDVLSLVYYHPDARKAEKLAKAAGVSDFCSDIGELASAADAAEVLSIPGGRAEVAESLLCAGVSLSLRKPLATSLEEAERLIRAAKNGNAHLRVDDEAFFYEPFLKLKEYIDKMEIGEIDAARFKVNLAGEGGWGPRAELLSGNNWIFHPCFDIVAFIIDLIGGVGSVISYTNPMNPKKGGQGLIGLKFKAPGCYGALELTYSPEMSIRTEGYPCDVSFEIAGTDGIIWVNHFYGKMTETPWIEIRRGKKYFSLGIGSGMKLEWPDAVRASAAHFAKRIAHGATPKPDIALHRLALKILLSARDAAETGTEIKV
jgi:predicted dehydrogenase